MLDKTVSMPKIPRFSHGAHRFERDLGQTPRRKPIEEIRSAANSPSGQDPRWGDSKTETKKEGGQSPNKLRFPEQRPRSASDARRRNRKMKDAVLLKFPAKSVGASERVWGIKVFQDLFDKERRAGNRMGKKVATILDMKEWIAKKYLKSARKANEVTLTLEPTFDEEDGRDLKDRESVKGLAARTIIVEFEGDKKMKVKVGKTYHLEDGRIGICKFVGETKFAKGQWVGLQLIRSWPMSMDNSLLGEGNNDGAVGGKRYFSCSRGKGVFVRPDRLTIGAPELAPSRRTSVWTKSSTASPGKEGGSQLDVAGWVPATYEKSRNPSTRYDVSLPPSKLHKNYSITVEAKPTVAEIGTAMGFSPHPALEAHSSDIDYTLNYPKSKLHENYGQQASRKQLVSEIGQADSFEPAEFEDTSPPIRYDVALPLSKLRKNYGQQASRKQLVSEIGQADSFEPAEFEDTSPPINYDVALPLSKLRKNYGLQASRKELVSEIGKAEGFEPAEFDQDAMGPSIRYDIALPPSKLNQNSNTRAPRKAGPRDEEDPASTTGWEPARYMDHEKSDSIDYLVSLPKSKLRQNWGVKAPRQRKVDSIGLAEGFSPFDVANPDPSSNDRPWPNDEGPDYRPPTCARTKTARSMPSGWKPYDPRAPVTKRSNTAPHRNLYPTVHRSSPASSRWSGYGNSVANSRRGSVLAKRWQPMDQGPVEGKRSKHSESKLTSIQDFLIQETKTPQDEIYPPLPSPPHANGNYPQSNKSSETKMSSTIDTPPFSPHKPQKAASAPLKPIKSGHSAKMQIADLLLPLVRRDAEDEEKAGSDAESRSSSSSYSSSGRLASAPGETVGAPPAKAVEGSHAVADRSTSLRSRGGLTRSRLDLQLDASDNEGNAGSEEMHPLKNSLRLPRVHQSGVSDCSDMDVLDGPRLRPRKDTTATDCSDLDVLASSSLRPPRKGTGYDSDMDVLDGPRHAITLELPGRKGSRDGSSRWGASPRHFEHDDPRDELMVPTHLLAEHDDPRDELTQPILSPPDDVDHLSVALPGGRKFSTASSDHWGASPRHFDINAKESPRQALMRSQQNKTRKHEASAPGRRPELELCPASQYGKDLSRGLQKMTMHNGSSLCIVPRPAITIQKSLPNRHFGTEGVASTAIQGGRTPERKRRNAVSPTAPFGDDMVHVALPQYTQRPDDLVPRPLPNANSGIRSRTRSPAPPKQAKLRPGRAPPTPELGPATSDGLGPPRSHQLRPAPAPTPESPGTTTLYLETQAGPHTGGFTSGKSISVGTTTMYLERTTKPGPGFTSDSPVLIKVPTGAATCPVTEIDHLVRRLQEAQIPAIPATPSYSSLDASRAHTLRSFSRASLTSHGGFGQSASGVSMSGGGFLHHSQNESFTSASGAGSGSPVSWRDTGRRDYPLPPPSGPLKGGHSRVGDFDRYGAPGAKTRMWVAPTLYSPLI